MLLFWLRMKVNELGIHLKRTHYNEMVNMENKFNKRAYTQHKSKLAIVMQNRLK